MEDLVGIETTPEGKLKLITKKGDIHLDGTTLSQDPDGNFHTSDGTTLDFGDNRGKQTFISGSAAGTSISCEKGCEFSIGEMDVQLQNEGRFKSLGDNRYDIDKGITTVGEDKLFGSYEFSMNEDHSGIDLSKSIDLNKYYYTPKGSFFGISYGGPIGSRVHISKDEHPEIEGLNDDLYFSNGKGIDNKVGICLYCTSFDANEYDGTVNLVQTTNNEMQNVASAEMKGLIAAGFGQDGKIDCWIELHVNERLHRTIDICSRVRKIG